MPHRIGHVAALGAITFAAVVFAQPAPPITAAALNGPWELKTLCMNNHSKPVGCVQSKHHALKLIFSTAGTWRIALSDPTQPTKSGLFDIRKETLLLKNADGSFFEEWHMDYSSDGQQLVITNKKNIQTFSRVTTSTE